MAWQRTKRNLALSITCLSLLLSSGAQAGRIIGTIRDNRGYALTGVSVQFYAVTTGALLWTTVSSPTGSFFVETVPPGTYNVVVAGPSCPYQQSVLVSPGAPADLEIQMDCYYPSSYYYYGTPGYWFYHGPYYYGRRYYGRSYYAPGRGPQHSHGGRH